MLTSSWRATVESLRLVGLQVGVIEVPLLSGSKGAPRVDRPISEYDPLPLDEVLSLSVKVVQWTALNRVEAPPSETQDVACEAAPPLLITDLPKTRRNMIEFSLSHSFHGLNHIQGKFQLEGIRSSVRWKARDILRPSKTTTCSTRSCQ